MSWPPEEDDFLHDGVRASVVPKLVFSEAAPAIRTGWISADPFEDALLTVSVRAIHRQARLAQHIHADPTFELVH